MGRSCEMREQRGFGHAGTCAIGPYPYPPLDQLTDLQCLIQSSRSCMQSGSMLLEEEVRLPRPQVADMVRSIFSNSNGKSLEIHPRLNGEFFRNH